MIGTRTELLPEEKERLTLWLTYNTLKTYELFVSETADLSWGL